LRAGRITQQLARHFTRVTGTDVSEDQIAYARSHVAGDHVNLQVTDGATLPLEDHSEDAVFSCHVFQYFDSLEGARVELAEVARVCRPGATLCIHLPLHDLPLPGHAARPLAAEPVAGAQCMPRRLPAPPRKAHHARPRLRTPMDRRNPRALGFSTIEFSAFRMQSNGDWHEVVLARKPA
jgi:SAM-dependent methyltransferase